MKQLRLANKLLQMLVRDRAQSGGQLFFDLVILMARFGVLMLIYEYVFNVKSATLAGVSFQEVAWSMMFYFAFSNFKLRGVTDNIMTDVKSGQIELMLTKPVSYLFQKMWWRIGWGAYSFVTGLIIGVIALSYYVDIPQQMLSLSFVVSWLIVMLNSIVLSLILYAIVGLCAFWMEDTTPLFWMIDKSNMILGGSYLPIALFPTLMYKIALWSPFGAAQFLSHTAMSSWQTEWLVKMSLQIGWIAILGLLLRWQYGCARRKLSINGG